MTSGDMRAMSKITGSATRGRGLTAAIALLVGMTLTACGDEEEPWMQPTMTRQEAIDRVETRIQQAVAQLPGEAKLELSDKTDSLPCDDPDDGGPAGRIIIEHDYWIRGLPKPYEQYFETLEQYWSERGYRKGRFTKRGEWWTMVYEDPDGFYVSLKTTGDGKELFIRSQSPCVWPNGTLAPETN